jgi:hypothetical protein
VIIAKRKEGEGEFIRLFQATYDDRFDYCLDSHIR